jgi:hypothetical protein
MNAPVHIWLVYCFQCFLLSNHKCQMFITSTIIALKFLPLSLSFTYLVSTEFRATCFLCRCFTIWTTLTAPFALGIFQTASHINAWTGMDHDPGIYASHITGKTGAGHHVQLLFVEMESCNFFCPGWPSIHDLFCVSQVLQV